jgi:pyruvate dehydrogenase E2 component (dihydrolipoamide acetyltransferase)
MMFEFKLPDLGEGIHEGEILKWFVGIGDTIKEDDPLVEIETDKAAVTIPSPRGGKLVSQSGKVGDTVKVGDVIAVIGDGEVKVTKAPEAPPAPKAAKAKEVAPTEEAPPTKPAAEKPPAPARPVPSVPAPRYPVPAAPATRRLAREKGIDINLVTPTGPAGRVTPMDVMQYLEGKEAPKEFVAPPAKKIPEEGEEREREAIAEFAAHAASVIPLLEIEPMPDFEQWGPVEKEALRSIRRKVARKMVTSMVLVPHVAHLDEADVTMLEEFRRKESERRKGQPGGHLTLLAFIVKAVTAGLKAAPSFNASLDPFKEEIIYKKYYNIGIAADTGRGLIVPVIKDTDRKSILQISADIEDLSGKAREGTLEVAELRGGTFTITNIGPLGGSALLPMINYPEVAILGVGRAQPKPVVRDGQIVIRTMLPLTLAFDHRIADGADAARFVTEMARQLSDPNLLLLET